MLRSIPEEKMVIDRGADRLPRGVYMTTPYSVQALDYFPLQWFCWQLSEEYESLELQDSKKISLSALLYGKKSPE